MPRSALVLLLLAACADRPAASGVDTAALLSTPRMPVPGDEDDDGAADALDCAPQDPAVWPGAPEVPGDGLDQDCDGVDTCFVDEDGDGFGGEALVADGDLDCDNGSAATSSRPGDCDDRPATGRGVHPDANEVCDGLDNNCDGQIDEIASPNTLEYFRDADGDGWGSVFDRVRACGRPVGFTERAGDCDDDNADANPEEEERCDGVDNNCRNGIDEGEAAGSVPCWPDADGDGVGEPGEPVLRCECPEGTVRTEPPPAEVGEGEKEEPAGCCATARGGPRGGLWAALALGLGVLRRRRG